MTADLGHSWPLIRTDAQQRNPDAVYDRAPPSPLGHLDSPLNPRPRPLFPRTLGAFGHISMGTDPKSRLLCHSELSLWLVPSLHFQAKFSLSPAGPPFKHLAEAVTSGFFFTVSQVPLEGGLVSWERRWGWRVHAPPTRNALGPSSDSS